MRQAQASRDVRPLEGEREASKARDGSSALLVIGVVAIVLGLNFQIGSLAMNLSRFMFLFLVPALTIMLLTGRYAGIRWQDILVFFNVFWIVLTIGIHNSDVAVSFAGSTAVTVLGGYLLTRCTILGPENFRLLAKILGWTVVVSLPFVLIESLTHRNLANEILTQIPGVSGKGRATAEQRLGLYRAQFLFPHPITFGLFCSLVFPMVFLGLRDVWSGFQRKVFCAAIGVCCFLSLSSGAVLALAVQFGIIGWGWVFANYPTRWRNLIALIATFYVVIELMSDRPALIAILTRVTLNPSTVQARRTLFDFGTAQIGETPILGVGYNDWGLPPWMSGSIDNFWLLQAVVHGMPAFLSLFAVVVVSAIVFGRRKFTGQVADLRFGWITLVCSMTLTLATVAVWGQMYTLIMVFIGAGVWMQTYKPPEEGENAEPSDAPTGRRSVRYSRFEKKPA